VDLTRKLPPDAPHAFLEIAGVARHVDWYLALWAARKYKKLHRHLRRARTARAGPCIHSEQWQVRSSVPIKRGQSVRVTARSDLIPSVLPVTEADQGA
jgi:hypothetical protein